MNDLAIVRTGSVLKFLCSFKFILLTACGIGDSGSLEEADQLYSRHYIDDRYTGGHISAHYAADINGDNYLDLVIRSGKSGAGEIAWYRNPLGDSELNEWQKFLIGHEKYPSGNRSSGSGLAVYDIDRDGQLDVIAGAKVDGIGNGLFWWRSPDDPMTGSWSRYLIAGPDPETGEELAPHDILVTDVNGDDIPDLVVAGASNQGTWWGEIPDNPRAGSQWNLHRVGEPRGLAYAGLAAGDLDNDGRVDIVRSDIWYRSSGPLRRPIWEPRAYGLINTPPSNIKLHDINADGELEIVVSAGHSESNGQIYWYARSDVIEHRWIPHLIGTGLAGPESLIVSSEQTGTRSVITSELDFANVREAPVTLLYETTLAGLESWKETTLFGDYNIRQLGEADIDQDGVPDLFGVTFANKAGNAQAIWFKRKQGRRP